jgi:hypothetical protein
MLAAACGPDSSSGDKETRDRLVGRWTAEKIEREKTTTFVLLNSSDGSFEMNERISGPNRATETLVWKGEWSVSAGRYNLNIKTLNANPLGVAHSVKYQSFKIEESTPNALTLLDIGYEDAVARFDKAGALREDHTYRYARTN